MQILTDMLFSLEYSQENEKRIYQYVEDTNPEYRELQNDIHKSFEYGSMLLDFAETDPKFFEQISLPAAMLLGKMNISHAEEAKNELRTLAKQTKKQLAEVPELFSVYKAKGLRAIEAVLEQKQWERQERQQYILEGFKGIFLNAHVIAAYIEQLNILLNANVFAEQIYNQKATAEIRMDMIYHLLGVHDESVNDYFYAPQAASSSTIDGISVTLPPDIMAPSDYSFLHDAEIRQKMMITADNDLHRLEYYIHADDTMQSMIMGYIRDMIENDAVIRKCKHCGRYFVAQGKTVYCNRTVDAQSNTCRKKGAMAQYTQNLDSAPEKKAYRLTYKNNFAKMKKGALSEAEFERWKKEAKKLKKDVESGSMPVEAFLDWLKYGE